MILCVQAGIFNKNGCSIPPRPQPAIVYFQLVRVKRTDEFGKRESDVSRIMIVKIDRFQCCAAVGILSRV